MPRPYDGYEAEEQQSRVDREFTHWDMTHYYCNRCKKSVCRFTTHKCEEKKDG